MSASSVQAWLIQLASYIQLLVYEYVFIVFAPVACMFFIIEILCISIRSFRDWNSWLKKENVSYCKIVICLFFILLNTMAMFSGASPSAQLLFLIIVSPFVSPYSSTWLGHGPSFFFTTTQSSIHQLYLSSYWLIYGHLIILHFLITMWGCLWKKLREQMVS
jgi:hypothetical protein